MILFLNRAYDYIIINADFLHQSPITLHHVAKKNLKGLK